MLEAEQGWQRCPPVLVQVPHTLQSQKLPEAAPMAAPGPEVVCGGFSLRPRLCSTCGGAALSPKRFPCSSGLFGVRAVLGEGPLTGLQGHGSGFVVTQASHLGYRRAQSHCL